MLLKPFCEEKKKTHKRERCFLSLNFFSSSSPSVASRLKPFLGFLRGPGKDSVLPGERGLDSIFMKECERSLSDAALQANGLENNSCVRACASVAVRAALL